MHCSISSQALVLKLYKQICCYPQNKYTKFPEKESSDVSKLTSWGQQANSELLETKWKQGDSLSLCGTRSKGEVNFHQKVSIVKERMWFNILEDLKAWVGIFNNKIEFARDNSRTVLKVSPIFKSHVKAPDKKIKKKTSWCWAVPSSDSARLL